MAARPSGPGRNPTAPPVMANGHFATIGDNAAAAAAYEHGVQVIDGDKEFKYGYHSSEMRLASSVQLVFLQ